MDVSFCYSRYTGWWSRSLFSPCFRFPESLSPWFRLVGHVLERNFSSLVYFASSILTWRKDEFFVVCTDNTRFAVQCCYFRSFLLYGNRSLFRLFLHSTTVSFSCFCSLLSIWTRKKKMVLCCTRGSCRLLYMYARFFTC